MIEAVIEGKVLPIYTDISNISPHIITRLILIIYTCTNVMSIIYYSITSRVVYCLETRVAMNRISLHCVMPNLWKCNTNSMQSDKIN